MKKNIDLINGPIGPTLRAFAIPLALSFVIHMLYSWVDFYYVSLISETAMAAMGTSERIWFFIFATGSGFAIGSGVIIARRVGEGNKDKANHTATQAVVTMFLFAITLAVALFFSINHILALIGIKGEVAALAEIYLSVICFGVPFHFLMFQVNAIVRSSGNSMYPMMTLILSNIINAIITPLLIFGVGPFPEMGIAGAGLGTAIAQLIGAGIAIYILLGGYTSVTLVFKRLKPDLPIMLSILKLGIPASLQMIVVSVNSIWTMTVANMFGTNILTTYMLGIRVDLFVYMSTFATGAAIEIISGQNLGAGKPERIFQYFYSAVKHLSVILIALGLLVFFGGEYFAMIFTDDPALIEQVHIYMRITAFTYIPFSIGLLAIRVISGAGAYFKSFFIVAAVMIGVQGPLVYILSQYTGLNQEGIWFGLLISSVTFFSIGLLALYRKRWMKAKV